MEPLEPVSNYGRSKLAAEQKLAELQNLLPISILRPGIVLGPEDRDGFEIFKGVALANLIVVPSFRNDIFSVIHVTDLVDAIMLVVDKGERLGPMPGQGTYHVSAVEQWSFPELGRIIGNMMGKTNCYSNLQCQGDDLDCRMAL